MRLVIALLVLSSATFSQQTLSVILKTGTVSTHSIDSIARITFDESGMNLSGPSETFSYATVRKVVFNYDSSILDSKRRETGISCRVFPNPFNPSTVLEITQWEKGNLKADIYDCQGRRIKTLCDKNITPGKTLLLWDGKNNANTPVSSGIYVLRINFNKRAFTGKLILAR